MSSITPFSATISQQEIDDLCLRLSLTRLPEKETVDDWSQGVPLSYLRDLLQHWQHNYAFDRFAQRLNAFPQFTATIDGIDIHFIHARSAEPNARPLLITHGWPGSVLEFMQVIAPLTDPVAHGGNAEDAFHVICPSLPGFGLSGKPEGRGWGIDRITRAWMELMQQLGYRRYFAQGGDWGSGITTHLGRLDTEHCACIHLNLLNARPTRDQRDELTEEEQGCLESLEQYNRWDSGYRWQQSTRPQTLGYGLTDSPVGQLAWIIEKFHAWTDCDGHPENAISRDDMLDNVMLYWLSATAASSARLYWESTHTAFSPSPVATPTGISIFPRDTHRGSRRWAETGYTNIVYWNRLERGGHFAAMEQPDLFVNELRACFRTQR